MRLFTLRSQNYPILQIGGIDVTIDPTKKKKELSYRWAIFAVLALAYFFVYFHRTTGGAISTDIQEFYGVGSAAVGLLASAYLYAYTLMQIPSGILTDRLGPRKAASAFVFLIAVGSILSAVSANIGNFDLMVVGKFIIGIGAAVVYIPIMKVLAVWFRKNEFASMSGILLLVGNVGGIAAATPMIIMIDSLGLEMTYVVLGIITVIIAVLCWVVVRNFPSEKGLPNIEEIESEETGQPIKEKSTDKIKTTEALRMTFGSGRKFWSLAVWFFCIYGTIMLWQASLAGKYYSGVYGFTSSEYGLLITMVGIGMCVGCPLAGMLADRVLHSKKKVVVLGTLVYTIIWAIIWITAGNLGSWGIQAVINFMFGFFGGFFVVSYAQIKELYPIAMAGTSTAALNLFPFAGGAILITIAGAMLGEGELADYKTIWLMAFVLMIIGLICAILSVEKGHEKPAAEASNT